MKIYRGPEKTDINDDPNGRHMVVAEVDLASLKPWSRRRRVKTNTSKDAYWRKPVVHVEFAPDDVSNLLKSHVNGLEIRSRKLEQYESLIKTLSPLLSSIKYASNSVQSGDDLDSVKKYGEKIQKKVTEAIQVINATTQSKGNRNGARTS